MSCLLQDRKKLGIIADVLGHGFCRQAPVIKNNVPLREIMAIFAEDSFSSRLYVVNAQEVFMGIVGLADILRYSFFYNHDPYAHAVSEAQLFQAESAEGFMRKRIFAKATDDIVDTMEKMVAAGLQEIVVTEDNERIRVLVTLGDLLRFYQAKGGGFGSP
ncbi:MAG: CBS domain-containing protein, partial [Proteobacteria bacterium]|nr:CBS domain-containing protein [Pseudomonadota bacterium]MBU1641517.1 CBS domain-containing protein [Pseudomonadota bacterium]